MSTSAYGEPIDGVVPPADYRPGQSRIPMVIGFTASYVPFAMMVFCLRVYVRRVILKAWGLDDWFLLGATVSVLSLAILGSWATSVGLGTRLYDLVKGGGNIKGLYWV